MREAAEQKCPHPNPLPSDARGRIPRECSGESEVYLILWLLSGSQISASFHFGLINRVLAAQFFDPVVQPEDQFVHFFATGIGGEGEDAVCNALGDDRRSDPMEVLQFGKNSNSPPFFRHRILLQKPGALPIELNA